MPNTARARMRVPLGPWMRRWSWLLVLGTCFIGSTTLVAVGFPAGNPASLQPPPLAQTTQILDVNGRLIARLHGEQDRTVLAHGDISDRLRDAVVAIEDHDFFKHGGVSLRAIVRSIVNNADEGKVTQGGSTITQQYVRNAFPSIGTERSLSRKVREAMLAMRIEHQLSKDEILDGYLNTVYFGRGAYGVQAAARTYFGTDAKGLSLDEAAFLAGVIRWPERYGLRVADGKARRDLVLDQMRTQGLVPEGEAARAKAMPLRLRRAPDEPTTGAYFVEYVRRLLSTPESSGGFGLSSSQVLTGGLTVHTTLDLRMQRAAEQAVASVLDRADDPETGMVSMTTDGQIRALVGGRVLDSITAARGFNYATQIAPGAGRQAGSAFKPFTLAAYLRKGYSPYRTYPAPSRVTVPECGAPGDPWRPANYDGKGYGSLDVIGATAYSVNTVYAQMVADVGPAAAVQAARDAGITSPLLPVCSIALGTLGVTPMEMARAYATFAARGLRPDPVAITSVVAPDGHVLAAQRPRVIQTIEPRIADAVNAILQGVMRRGTGRPAATNDGAEAGKTGTTEEHRDVWFAGYTPAPGLSTAIWIGYPPDAHGVIRAMHNLHGRAATGGGFAGVIWKRYMQAVPAGTRVGKEFATVDMHDGWDRAAPSRSFADSRVIAPPSKGGASSSSSGLALVP